MGAVEREPADLELSPSIEVLARRFIQRWDMYPKQLASGQYVTIHELLHTGLLFDHLRGTTTLGTYLLDAKSQGRFLVLDADDEADWRRLAGLATFLREEHSGGYLEKSRRGGHLWAFLAEPKAGRDIRAFGRGLCAYFKIEGIELFPKQDEVTDGPGSLIRLPFGVHQKTGRRYGFYLPDGTPLAASLRQQIMALSAPETLSEGLIERMSTYEALSKESPPEITPERPAGTGWPAEALAPISERIKAAIPVRQFVLRYVELSPNGQGLCPFHDEQHPSLSVNDQKNYWHCFACGKGGSVVDFYMQLKQCDFKTAVSELAEMYFPR